MDAMKSDAELLRETGRDPGAFRVVYERHVSQIYGYLKRETRDPETAMDLTAETFARALCLASRFRATRADRSAESWLYGIAHNLLREYRRSARIARDGLEKLQIEPWQYDHEALATVDGRLDATKRASQLEDALAELPPGQRDAVVLRVLEELPYREISERL